jgi:predicted transcriptional regulator
MIRGYVRVHPGDCYTDLKRNLGLANGELAYHLKVLEREGIIQTSTRGARRLYYPSDVPIPEDGGGLHEVQARILKHLEDVPGMTVKDLAGLLGISAQLAMYHVRRLYGEGLVRFERSKLRFLVFLASAEEREAFERRTGDQDS